MFSCRDYKIDSNRTVLLSTNNFKAWSSLAFWQEGFHDKGVTKWLVTRLYMIIVEDSAIIKRHYLSEMSVKFEWWNSLTLYIIY